MPSSKFNRRPVSRRRPPICIAPAGSCLPPENRRQPTWIHGYAAWIDLDIFFPARISGIIAAGPRTVGGLYNGEHTRAGVRLGINIQDLWPLPSVVVQIYIFDPWRNPETFTWPPVPMPPDQPFNTRLLTKTFVPVIDIRNAWFAE